MRTHQKILEFMNLVQNSLKSHIIIIWSNDLKMANGNNIQRSRESLVRAEEQAFRFNNFGSRIAFSIILYREFFVQSDAPISGIFFLNFSPNSLHLKHC